MRRVVAALAAFCLVAVPAYPQTVPTPTPPPAITELCVREVRFQGSYIHAVNETGVKAVFGPSEGGSTRNWNIRAPEGKAFLIRWNAETREAFTGLSDCTPGPTPSPSPSTTPTPGPTPTPTPSSTPTPDPSPSGSPSPGPSPTPAPKCANCGTGIKNADGTFVDAPTGFSKECVYAQDGSTVCKWPEWKPLTCAPQAGDPPGLERSGPACDTPGGNGSGKLFVTNLNDSGPGSFRKAINDANGTHRQITCGPEGVAARAWRAVVDFTVGASPYLQGDLVLQTPIYIDKPYMTFDFSQCDVTIKSAAPKTNILVIAFGAHDLIFYSMRTRGWFGMPNWVMTNNAGQFAMDGQSTPKQWPWDKDWAQTAPSLRHVVRNILFDRVSASGCEDDCLMPWDGVTDVSVVRSLIAGFHPTSLGAPGWPLVQDRWRKRIAYMYGAWVDSGERQPKPRESAHLWAVIRMLTFNWTWHFDKNGQRSEAMGLNISDDATNENDFGYVIGACYLAGPGAILRDPQGNVVANHSKWGVIVGNGWTCDGDGPYSDPYPTNYPRCHKYLKNSHFWFEAVEGDVVEGGTNPPDWVPAGGQAITFPIDKARPWQRVLDELGPVFRGPIELDAVARMQQQLPRCVPVAGS